jgi:hypothetical protein
VRDFIDAANTAVNIGTKLATMGPVGWGIIAAVLIILIVVFIMFGGGSPAGLLFGQGDGGTPQTPGGPGSPGGGATGDISACLFYRGGSSPVAEQFKSGRLITYFEEAAAASGVPAAVLAGIARVETSVSLGYTDETLDTAECPKSSAGALGLMQIVPVFQSDETCESCRGIARGAAYLGKTVEELTETDYCNARTSIFLGAGFILEKMKRSGGDGTWNPAWTTSQTEISNLARYYYGGLKYGENDEFDYGEDLWNSVSSCRPATPGQGPVAAGSCPIASGVVTCGSQMTPVNGPLGLCGHCSVGYKHPCDYEGTKHAIDIDGEPGDSAILPTVNGNNMKWTFYPDGSRGGNDAIIAYSGEDMVTGLTYYLHFHHVAGGSQIDGSAYSGDVGAKICDTCNHLHVQLGTGAPGPGSTNWADAAQFFCTEPAV